MIVSLTEVCASATAHRSNSRCPVEGILSPLYCAEAAAGAAAEAVFFAGAFVAAAFYAARRSLATYSCRHGEPWRVRIFIRFNWSAIFRRDLPPFLSR